jgi:hypothetical protein
MDVHLHYKIGLKKNAILLGTLLLVACSFNRHSKNTRIIKLFEIVYVEDTINLKVKYFIENTAHCSTEAIPYALIIGEMRDSLHNPMTISVIAKCDNEKYIVGQSLRVIQMEDPTKDTSLSPLYFVNDTVINKIVCRWIIGSEYPAVWGRVIR